MGDDRARVAGWGLDPPPPSDPAPHGARSASRGPTRSASGGSTSRRASATWSSTTRATGGPCPTASTWCSSGGGDAPLPAHPWLHRLGYVEEPVKHDALAGAAVVVLPSPYESLSLVQLEAWSHGRPTLANAASPVLVGQSRRSGGGLWYRDGDEYAAMLDLLARARPLADAIGRQGRRLVAETCSWDRVRAVWLDALALAAGRAAAAGGDADGAVLSIYGARAACSACLAGVALAGLLDHRGRWVGLRDASRSGFCVLVTLLYPLGALMPGIAGGAGRARRSSSRRSPSPSRSACGGRAPGQPPRRAWPARCGPTWAEAAVLRRAAIVAGAADPGARRSSRASRPPSP